MFSTIRVTPGMERESARIWRDIDADNATRTPQPVVAPVPEAEPDNVVPYDPDHWLERMRRATATVREPHAPTNAHAAELGWKILP